MRDSTWLALGLGLIGLIVMAISALIVTASLRRSNERIVVRELGGTEVYGWANRAQALRVARTSIKRKRYKPRVVSWDDGNKIWYVPATNDFPPYVLAFEAGTDDARGYVLLETENESGKAGKWLLVSPERTKS